MEPETKTEIKTQPQYPRRIMGCEKGKWVVTWNPDIACVSIFTDGLHMHNTRIELFNLNAKEAAELALMFQNISKELQDVEDENDTLGRN